MHCKAPKLIVMLTYNDRTIKNAFEIFDECKALSANYWGIKQEGISLNEMKYLFAYMKKCRKMTVLEVVAYTEQDCINGARIAAECGCDILMGTLFFDSVNEICKENKLKYMPFVGRVSQCPSILEGHIEDLLVEAQEYLEKGVYGLDLLGYRYNGNAEHLSEVFISGVSAQVCLAGSINSLERLEAVKRLGPWGFTIGGAFYEKIFGGSYSEQIELVCGFLEGKNDRKILSERIYR